MTTTTRKMIPPPPSARRTVASFKPGDDAARAAAPAPWDFPLDLGITRNNRGAHGGLTEAGKADAAKVRAIKAQAAQEGRYTR